MEIPLDLGRHCIQTEIKKIYNQRISAYFKAGSPETRDAIAAEISLLKTALEILDFGKLRTDFPVLQGGGPERIRIGQERDGGGLYISVNGKVIYETISHHPVS